MRTIIILILLLILIYLIRDDTKYENKLVKTISITESNQVLQAESKNGLDILSGLTGLLNTSGELLNTSGDLLNTTLNTSIEVVGQSIDQINNLNLKQEVDISTVQEVMNKIPQMPQMPQMPQIIPLIESRTEASLDSEITEENMNEESNGIINGIQSINWGSVKNEAPIKYPVNFVNKKTSNQETVSQRIGYPQNQQNQQKIEISDGLVRTSTNCMNPIVYNYLHRNTDNKTKKEKVENFGNVVVSEQPEQSFQLSFKKINPNKLYYGLTCKYIKNDSFYDALKDYGFVQTDGKNGTIVDACLIVPCSYETTEKEIDDLVANGINKNIYGDGVRIFMLNNTDYMVSKLSLWKFLVNRYGEKVASTMIPYTWDLTSDSSVEKFKKEYDSSKLYITKNNLQRQEGIEIHNSLDSVINSRGKALLVQELLQNPYLISGRKINLRVYVLVMKDTKGNFKICIYNNGFMYYTPELFEKNSNDFKKNVTTGYIDRQVYVENPLTHGDFREYLDSTRKLTPIEEYLVKTRPNTKLSDYVFSQIYHLLSYIIEPYDETLGTKTLGVSFQLYGADIAIDDELRPQIMEINKGPDLSAKDDRDKKLKIGMCKHMLKTVGLVQDDNSNGFITCLERVVIDGKKIYINNFLGK